MAQSYTGGVKPMSITGRMIRERERLIGMTDEERAWRKQWLKDQILAHDEPRFVPEYWKERINPIRRMYRFPLDKAFEALTPVMGETSALYARYFTGKFIIFGFALLAGHYYFKYNSNDWTRKGGWRVLISREHVLPGSSNYPQLSDRSVGADYAERGFKSSPI